MANNDPDKTPEKLAEYKDYAKRTRNLIERDIWELEHLGRKTVRARLYHLLRVLTLTWQGLRRNKIPVQAAALTFYSLIGIGPLIALGIMVSGFALQQGDNKIVTEGIYKAIAFAAPQIALESEGENALSAQMVTMIDNFSSAATSGTVGIVGIVTLFFIGIQVLSSIEGSFNTLWGVDKGRKFSERIVTYWTFISLGAVLGTLSLTLVAANAFVRIASDLPFGSTIAALIQLLSPLIAFILFSTLLAVFFRFIPNTKVKWGPAFGGSVIVMLLLHAYNLLSFLYVERVVQTNSLYGSVGIIVVLMLGLYVFWLLILLGGQVTYAIQNADFLTNENAWQKTSERAREIISLSIVLLVMQRFQAGLAPLPSSEILKKIRVPSHILNSSIARLCELGYLVTVERSGNEQYRDRAYVPGLPASNLTLGAFKQSLETFGNNEGADIVASTDSKIHVYTEEILPLIGCESAQKKLSELLD